MLLVANALELYSRARLWFTLNRVRHRYFPVNKTHAPRGESANGLFCRSLMISIVSWSRLCVFVNSISSPPGALSFEIAFAEGKEIFLAQYIAVEWRASGICSAFVRETRGTSERRFKKRGFLEKPLILLISQSLIFVSISCHNRVDRIKRVRLNAPRGNCCKTFN